jgi:hypothetical protein
MGTRKYLEGEHGLFCRTNAMTVANVFCSLIFGESVCRQSGMARIRQSMGLCPQVLLYFVGVLGPCIDTYGGVKLACLLESFCFSVRYSLELPDSH